MLRSSSTRAMVCFMGRVAFVGQAWRQAWWTRSILQQRIVAGMTRMAECSVSIETVHHSPADAEAHPGCPRPAPRRTLRHPRHQPARASPSPPSSPPPPRPDGSIRAPPELTGFSEHTRQLRDRAPLRRHARQAPPTEVPIHRPRRASPSPASPASEPDPALRRRAGWRCIPTRRSTRASGTSSSGASSRWPGCSSAASPAPPAPPGGPGRRPRCSGSRRRVGSTGSSPTATPTMPDALDVIAGAHGGDGHGLAAWWPATWTGATWCKANTVLRVALARTGAGAGGIRTALIRLASAARNSYDNSRSGRGGIAGGLIGTP